MEHKGLILIADDEPDILEILGFNLEREGYSILTAKDGNQALDLARKFRPDLIILDIMMPFKTGIEVCHILRMQPEFRDTLIVMLTAMSDEGSHVKGLDSGADDYIGKPVSPKVLVSRVNALFRRLNKDKDYEQPLLSIGALTIDPQRFVVTVNGRDVVLAKKEFELLYLLASRPGRVFLRNEILSNVWGSEVIVGDRTIDVHIRKIRQKLDVDCISTVKGVGYKFQLD
jgi:two-component system alkaline phosphatase synthesis response regulator PhoP